MPKRPAPLFLARASYRQRRLRDAARLLPIVGILLWVIPLLWSHDASEPTLTSDVLIYVFVVWGLLILGSLALSRWLTLDEETAEPEDAD